jgi:hypothetical protein
MFFLGKASLRYHRWFAGNNSPQEILGECSHLNTYIIIYIYLIHVYIYIYIFYRIWVYIKPPVLFDAKKKLMMVRNPSKKSILLIRIFQQKS